MFSLYIELAKVILENKNKEHVKWPDAAKSTKAKLRINSRSNWLFERGQITKLLDFCLVCIKSLPKYVAMIIRPSFLSQKCQLEILVHL